MRRGQAALEFLSTYGWAILMILVAISALAYLNIFNFKNLVPERCVITDFNCESVLSKSGMLNLILSYKLDKSLTIHNINVTCLDCKQNNGNSITYSEASCSIEGGSFPFVLKRLDDASIHCDFSGDSTALAVFDSGEKVKFSIKISYTPIGKVYPKVAEGELFLLPQ